MQAGEVLADANHAAMDERRSCSDRCNGRLAQRRQRPGVPCRGTKRVPGLSGPGAEPAIRTDAGRSGQRIRRSMYSSCMLSRKKLHGEDADVRRRKVSAETPPYSNVPDVSSTTSTRRAASKPAARRLPPESRFISMDSVPSISPRPADATARRATSATTRSMLSAAAPSAHGPRAAGPGFARLAPARLGGGERRAAHVSAPPCPTAASAWRRGRNRSDSSYTGRDSSDSSPGGTPRRARTGPLRPPA
jgi:hypothetical protein